MPKEPLSEALLTVPPTSKIRGYRYLTCQGGGMKGTGYVGAVEILEEMGVMSQIEAVAGSSAGAIFATLVAVGYTAKEIREEMTALDFRRLQDKESPGWVESSGIPDLAKGFTPTEKNKTNLLKKLSVVKQLIQLPEKVATGMATTEDVVQLAFGSRLGLWKGDALLSLIQRLIARKTGKPNLTFKELAELAKIRPKVFRNLILTGSNLTTSEKEFYTAEEWPDMPIMQAVRISASFPGAFMPVTEPVLKRKVGSDGKPEYVKGLRVDGGLLESLPDIFNKPPYFHPEHEYSSNPEVLALSFKETHDTKDEIESGIDLLKALYKTKMSEADLKRKYGDNIVYIDTKGVGTLDFDVEKEKRDALSDSGWECVAKVFTDILEKEKKTKFSDLSLEELLRYKAFMLADPSIASTERLSSLNDYISQKAKEQGISREELQAKEKDEKQKLLRMREILAKGRSESVSDQQLMESCQQKLIELENIKTEQGLQIRELELVMAGFELRKVEFQDKFDRKINKEWVEIFEGHLAVVKNLRDRRRNIKIRLAGFEREYHILENKFSKHEISESQLNAGKIRLEAHKRDLNVVLEDLTVEKNKFIKEGMIAYYKRKHDDFMCHFFEELNEEFDRPVEQPDPHVPEKYRFPEKCEDIIGFIDKQQEICKGYLKEARQKRKDTDNEIKIFHDRLQSFQKRTFASSKYETLKIMEKELERSIYEKTSLIAKINNYFVSDSPSLKNNLVTGVMQFVAFTAFTARIAIATAVGVATFPWSIYKLVNFIKNHNSEGPAKVTADRYLRAFSMPNLFKLNKLRYLSKVTSDAVSVLDKNYDNADSTEHAHVYKLHQLYLQKTLKKGSFKPKFSDIFTRKSEDTTHSYQTMLDHFKQELSIEEADYVKRKTAEGGLQITDPKASEKFPIFKNLENFHEKIKENLLKKDYRFTTKRPEQLLYPAEMHRAEVSSKNVALVNVEFLNNLDKLIREKKPNKNKSLALLFQEDFKAKEKGKQASSLSRFWKKSVKGIATLEAKHISEEEIVWKYIEAAKALDKPLPDYIRKQFDHQLHSLKPEAIPNINLKAYVEAAEHYKINVPEPVMAAFEQQIQQERRATKESKERIESALMSFYQHRSKETRTSEPHKPSHKPGRPGKKPKD